MSRGAFVQSGLCPEELLFRVAYVQRSFCSEWLMSRGAFVQSGLCPEELLFRVAYVQRSFCLAGLLFLRVFLSAHHFLLLFYVNQPDTQTSITFCTCSMQ